MPPYVKVIDLTSKATSRLKEKDEPKEPDSPLPEVTVDTLPDDLRDAVRRLGWTSLMPVQAKTIPYMLAGRDMMVQSRTGSGKTGAFLLPLIAKLDPNERRPQALILSPTRELARQIFETFEAALPDDHGLKAISVYGGVGYGPQIKAFKEGVQLVVGTPGRILDHLEKGTLTLAALKVLIFDEADEMLSVGFWPAMKQLRRFLPNDRESYMFSATIPYNVRVLAEDFLYRPGFLSLGKIRVDEMTHFYTVTPPMEKNRVLVRYIELENPDSAIIFANTKKRVEFLGGYLQNCGFNARGLSGDLPQKERERVMGEIRDGKIRFLVATDVAARGIDISNLSHIIMYDVPQDSEYYVHRAGRTARAGNAGIVITLATVGDKHALTSIAKKFGLVIEERPIPTDAEVQSHVCARVIEILEARIREESPASRDYAQSFVPLVTGLMSGGHIDWLSMLFDDFYHESLHIADSEPVNWNLERPPPTGADLEEALQERLAVTSGHGKERLQRFAPLVRQLIEEGEPELPAMLLADFVNAKPKPANQSRRSRSNNRPVNKQRGGRR